MTTHWEETTSLRPGLTSNTGPVDAIPPAQTSPRDERYRPHPGRDWHRPDLRHDWHRPDLRGHDRRPGPHRTDMLASRPDMLATRRIEVPHEPVTERLVRGDVAVLEDRQVTERLKVVEADAEGLVAPPGDDEVYSYFGPQMRWVQVLLMAAYVLAGWSLLQFALASVKVLWPMLIVLGLNVIGTVLSALTSFNTRRVSAKTHRALFEGWAGPASNIDVSLPKYGEDLAVLRNTYTHVKAGGNPRLAHSRGSPQRSRARSRRAIRRVVGRPAA